MLIVIAIVGVVAALTIPTLITNIEKILNPNRTEVIEDRLLSGLKQLNTMDSSFESSQYNDTEGFVRALSKYYKMNQICGVTELNKCFPYSGINYESTTGAKVLALNDLENLRSSGKLRLNPDEWLPPAAFISAQGTPFVMFLKKNCTKDTGEAMNNIPTDCIQYIYDNNGANNPNKFDVDIAHSEPLALGIKVPDGTLEKGTAFDGYKTYLIFGDNIPAAINTCDGKPDYKWDTKGSQNGVCSTNYWAAAKKACAEAGYELPHKDTLAKLACRVHGRTNYSDYGTSKTCDTTKTDTTLIKALRVKKPNITSNTNFWSSTPNSQNAAWQQALMYGTTTKNAVYGGFSFVCLGK